MKDTAWFQDKERDEQLEYLSRLMYRSDEEAAKEEFGTLLKLMPVDMVFCTEKFL